MRSLILVIAAGLALAGCGTTPDPYYPQQPAQTPPPPPPPGPGAA